MSAVLASTQLTGTGPTADIVSAQERPGAIGRAAPISDEEYGNYLIEIHDQPPWRRMADRDADYYDNNQLDQETLAEIERRGMLPIVENLIQPVIDVVLGLEAKMRTDWRVQADSDDWQEVAEGLSSKLFEAEREAKADRACADAHAGQVKAGLGWVQVMRSRDPFDYPYDVQSIHRREMYWDWNDRTTTLKDARYLIRRRWFDVETVVAYFPQYAEALRGMAGGWAADMWLRNIPESADRGFELGMQGRISVEDWEWRDTTARRLALFEVWYRRAVRGYVFRVRDQAVEFDQRNPMHVALVGSGRVKPQIAVFSKLRRAIYCGPMKLSDGDQARRRTFYTPFWGYREDLTGAPYGLIRPMVGQQDEVNARNQKMLWLLSAKRVTMDSDALDTQQNDVSEVLEEIARADAVVQLNPNRQNRDASAFKVDDNLTLADAQFKVLQDKRESLQKVRGIFNAMLGNEKGAQSGIAINSLVEQSMTVLAAIQSNYQESRRQVGQDLTDLIREDIGGQPVEVMVSGEGARKKTIILNKRVKDPETGMPVIENDVQRSRVKVALEDVPSTPAYRAQQMLIMSEALKSAPPEVQMILYPAYLESSEHPRRRELADQIRKMAGTQDPSMLEPEEREAFEAEQQAAAEFQKRLADAQLAAEEAKTDELVARAAKIRAEAERLTDGVDGEVSAAVQHVQQAAAEQMRTLETQIQQLKLAIQDKREEVQKKYETEVIKARLAAAAEIEVAKVNTSAQQVVDALTEKLVDIQDELKATEQRMTAERDKAVLAAREKAAAENTGQFDALMKQIAESTEDSSEAMTEAVKALGEMLKQSNAEIAEAVKQASAVDATDSPVDIELETDAKGKAVGATVRKDGKTRKFAIKTDEKGAPIGATEKKS